MKTEEIKHLFEEFESVASEIEGIECWSARELQKLLGYSKWENFEKVILKAKDACTHAGEIIEHHFPDVRKMVMIGSDAERIIEDIALTRYACYLIVQNADPNKEIVALGQTYFAVQTRLQEIRQMDEYNRLSTENEKRLFLRNEMAKHNTQLAAAAKDAGVIEPIDYAIFQK